MPTRVVQFEVPGGGRRIGVVAGEAVRDVTSVRPEWRTVLDVVSTVTGPAPGGLSQQLNDVAGSPRCRVLSYDALSATPRGGSAPWLLPPIDHPDPHRVLITGTGLTHLGGMKSRDQMHGGQSSSTEPQTDSAKMFAMGIAGGAPKAGERGAAPEWFYKGNGFNLRGPNESLELPTYALDGGEEPEIAGIYIIDADATPRRLGFVLANEWSDHATEKINYLYLAPSKLRTCAIGPELVLDRPFDDIRLRCTVSRNGETLYDSGELFSGEKAMCHSLANCEDHHFKYPQHRVPGDVHVHFFGTSKLSYSTRKWKYQPGDAIRIEAPGFSAPLVNTVVAGDPKLVSPVQVVPA